MKKDIKKLLKELARQGFTVRTTRRGHHMVYRDGTVVGSIAGTPSDCRALKNAIATLRHAGFTTV